MARADLAWVLAPLVLAVLLRLPLGAISLDDVPWPDGVIDDRSMTESHRTAAALEPDWVLLVGGSSAYFAFDRTDLGWPVHKQTFARGFPSDVALALSWTLNRSLPVDRHPTRVVWGLTLASLVDRQDDAIHPCTTAVARSRPEPGLLKQTGTCADLDEHGTLADRVSRQFARVDPWYGRRASTQDLAVSWVRALLAWPTPPSEPDTWHGFEGQNEARHARNTQAWERFGVFDADAIHGPHAATVQQVVTLCAEASIDLTIVSMPEPSDIRARYEPHARARFDALLADSGVDVLDLFAAVPDSGFYDQAHVNTEGRQVATDRLEAHLRAITVAP